MILTEAVVLGLNPEGAQASQRTLQHQVPSASSIAIKCAATISRPDPLASMIWRRVPRIIAASAGCLPAEVMRPSQLQPVTTSCLRSHFRRTHCSRIESLSLGPIWLEPELYEGCRFALQADAAAILVL